MSALAADFGRDTKAGPYHKYAVKGSTTIYRGSAVGLTSGYARALVAGDIFVGFNLENKVVNTGSDGDVKADILTEGQISLPITSVAVTDIGKAVYATTDNDFTVTPTTDAAAIGHIVAIDYNKSGHAIVHFKRNFKAQTKIAAPTGGGTVDTECRAAVASLLTAGSNFGITIKN